MRVETTEFVLPVWVLPYIFDGDFSGLTDVELEKADKLEKQAQRLCDANKCDSWCFGVETCDDPEFSTHNDVDGYVGGDVQRVVLSMFAKDKGKVVDNCVEITGQSFNAIINQYKLSELEVDVVRSEYALKTYMVTPDGSRLLKILNFLDMVAQYYIQDINA